VEIGAILEMTRGRKVTVLAGLIEENPKSKPFITQVIIRNGLCMGYYRKNTVKDDDNEWFSPGDAIPVFTHDDLSFGIAICSDISNERVFAECARQGAQIVFELAAPGLHGEQANRNWRSGFEWWEGECKKYLEIYAKNTGVGLR
jgi:predicted amidohydrolase